MSSQRATGVSAAFDIPEIARDQDYFHSIVDKDGSPATVEIAYLSSIFELSGLTR